MLVEIEGATETVELLTALLITDEFGTPSNQRDWPNMLPPQAYPGCYFQPVTTAEYLGDGRASVMTRFSFWGPPDMPLTADMRIRRLGVDYEVDGEVQRWPDVDGLSHVEAILKSVRG